MYFLNRFTYFISVYVCIYVEIHLFPDMYSIYCKNPPIEDISVHFYDRMNHTIVPSSSLISPYIMRLSCEPKIHCSLLTYLKRRESSHTHTK